MRMGSTALTNILIKSHHAGATVARNPWSSRGFVSAVPRPFQASWRHEAAAIHTYSATDTAKQGANETTNAGQDLKNMMSQKTKDAAGKVADTAEDLTVKAKQTAEDGSGSVKDTLLKRSKTRWWAMLKTQRSLLSTMQRQSGAA